MEGHPNVPDRWLSVAIPILQGVAELERDTSTVLDLGTFTDRFGVVAEDALVELERLMAAGYIDGNILRVMGDVRENAMASFRLLERGARAVGVWPSEDPFEALLRVIEIRIGEETSEDSRTNLRKVRDAVMDMGKTAGTSVVGGLLLEAAKAATR